MSATADLRKVGVLTFGLLTFGPSLARLHHAATGYSLFIKGWLIYGQAEADDEEAGRRGPAGAVLEKWVS